MNVSLDNIKTILNSLIIKINEKGDKKDFKLKTVNNKSIMGAGNIDTNQIAISNAMPEDKEVWIDSNLQYIKGDFPGTTLPQLPHEYKNLLLFYLINDSGEYEYYVIDTNQQGSVGNVVNFSTNYSKYFQLNVNAGYSGHIYPTKVYNLNQNKWVELFKISDEFLSSSTYNFPNTYKNHLNVYVLYNNNSLKVFTGNLIYFNPINQYSPSGEYIGTAGDISLFNGIYLKNSDNIFNPISQSKLYPGKNIKTINGQNILGEGDLEVSDAGKKQIDVEGHVFGEVFNDYTNNSASEYLSHAEGSNTIASNRTSHAQGHYNAAMIGGGNGQNTTGTAFAIGNGSSDTNRSNAFSVQFDGTTAAAGTITASTTADYAENFEWLDGNLEEEDRVGYFVTLDGDKIKIADSTSDYILGIVSGAPFVLGNGDCDVWNGMYLRDKYNRILTEPAPKVEEIIDEETGKITFKEIEGEFEGTRWVVNPEYDNTQPYIPRRDRKEWSPVGMLGVLAVRQDGTLKKNGFAAVADGGIATSAEIGYRVIEIIDEETARVIFR